jgi:hypothetical protein
MYIWPESSAMVVRIILAALISISVAMVPAVGGGVDPGKPVEMSMPDHADMPCCAPDDCKGSIACAFKCFNFVGTTFPAMVLLPYAVDAAPPSYVDGILREHVRSPPTHPPPNLTAFQS